nr:MAG TPA: hypothetical protein [Caudoviricetes sp.]
MPKLRCEVQVTSTPVWFIATLPLQLNLNFIIYQRRC